MNKRQNIIFDGIIQEYFKAEKQIVRPRFMAILRKLKNKIQADSTLVTLYEFRIGLKKQLVSDVNIVN